MLHTTNKISLVPHGFIYFFYFSTIGIMVTFFPPFLRDQGFSGTQMGVAMAVPPMVAIFSPLLWGYCSDRIQRPLFVLRLNLFLSALIAFSFFSLNGFLSAVGILFLYAFFRSPIPSLTDANCLSIIAQQGGDYGRVRLWGSMGFVVSSMSIGLLMDQQPDYVDYSIKSLVGLFVLALATAFFISVRPPPQERADLRDIWILFRNPKLRVLFLAAGVHWASTAPYHGFLSVHIQDLGWSTSIAGYGFALAGLTEVVMMGSARSWLKRFGARKILVISLAVSSLRWLLTAWVSHPLILVLIQGLHAFTFAAFYIASIEVLLEEIPETLRATGQGLFFSTAFGVGGGLGVLFTGMVYETYGGVNSFLFGAGLSFFATVIARRL